MTGHKADQLRVAGSAGRFFAGDPAALKADVSKLLDTGGDTPGPTPSRPRAVISPHAGYAYSGKLTATALGASAGWNFERIVVLSPAHRHGFEGVALPSQDGYALPGTNLAIDGPARDALVRTGLARVLDAAHDFEHGIETQLPFLAALHPDARVVPLVIGHADVAQVAKAVDFLADDPVETLFVLSSDLSHFLTQDQAVARDQATAQKIETGDHGGLTGEDACGARGIAGYLASLTGRGARALRLGMTSSYATTGDASRVVGYGAWSLHGPGDDMLDKAHRTELLRVARTALERRVTRAETPGIALAEVSPRLLSHAASFVTLEAEGQLRGCIGSLAPRAPLVHDVAENVIRAGFSDPRFAPVGADELQRIRIKVSVLSRPAKIDFTDEPGARAALVPGETGVVLIEGRHRGVFLPQVWDSLTDPEAFLNGLKRKAGLRPDHWSDALELHLFRGEVFGEAA